MTEDQPTRKKVFGYAEVTMDKAGRIVLPGVFSKYTDCPANVRILREPSGVCLEVRTESDFSLLVERIVQGCQKVSSSLYEAVLIEYLGFSDYCSVDVERRLLIPERYRKLLNSADGKLVLTGIGDGFWIWTQKAYLESREARQALLQQNRAFIFDLAQGRLLRTDAQCVETSEKVTQV
jgi:DNA-binding transcriptional regulator/RsmH inhibitor MraZ